MAKFYSKASLALSVIIGLGTSSHLYADDGVTWADIENDAKTPENVLMYGMGPDIPAGSSGILTNVPFSNPQGEICFGYDWQGDGDIENPGEYGAFSSGGPDGPRDG